MKILTTPVWYIKNLLSGKAVKRSPKDLGDWALISISDGPVDAALQSPEDVLKLGQYGCSEVLRLYFLDVEDRRDWEEDVFSEEQALQVLEFLRKHSTEDTIVVQCGAGVSRSGAIGLFASRYFKLDEGVFQADNPNIDPNDHVYLSLANLVGLSGQYKEWWKSVALKDFIW